MFKEEVCIALKAQIKHVDIPSWARLASLEDDHPPPERGHTILLRMQHAHAAALAQKQNFNLYHSKQIRSCLKTATATATATATNRLGTSA